MKRVLDVIAVGFLAFWLWGQWGGGGLPDLIPSERLIDLPGVSVLVVYQDTELPRVPSEQRDIISGAEWFGLVPEGQARMVDADTEFTADTPFKEVFDRHPQQLPWCVVSGPGQQHEGELPATVSAMVDLVEAAQ